MGTEQGRLDCKGAPVVVRGPVLLIGYGNTLRGDDGLGPRVADAVEAWRIPGVRCISAHQLTPEMADAVSAAGTVLFVDAAADPALAVVTATSVVPMGDGVGHASTPGSLLALTLLSYGRCPPALLIALPAERFDFGEALSAKGERSLAEALALVRSLVEAARARGTL